jgi:hypothetical protein
MIMKFSLQTPAASRATAGVRMHGARMLASAARIGNAVWHALQAAGQARARQELLRAAERYETTQPELAKQLRAASRFDALSL